MMLRIGDRIHYQLQLHPGRLHFQGERCLGLCNHDQRTLLIAGDLPPDEMFEVMCHEYWHAFAHTYGHFAHDEESSADLFALATRQFMQSLRRAGVMKLAMNRIAGDVACI